MQAGMTFNELQEVLLAKGMSLPGIIMAPTFGEMTVGAALVTASHGRCVWGCIHPSTTTTWHATLCKHDCWKPNVPLSPQNLHSLHQLNNLWVVPPS